MSGDYETDPRTVRAVPPLLLNARTAAELQAQFDDASRFAEQFRVKVERAAAMHAARIDAVLTALVAHGISVTRLCRVYRGRLDDIELDGQTVWRGGWRRDIGGEPVLVWSERFTSAWPES